MSDNAASHETAQNEVHPEANTAVPTTLANASSSEVQNEQTAPVELTTIEGVDGDVALDLDEEGFDPATLANLAALSRLARDEGDEDDEIEHDFSSLVPEQNLNTDHSEQGAGPSQNQNQNQSQSQSHGQQGLTTEQVRDIVSRLGEERGKGSEDGSEGEGDDAKEERATDGGRTEDGEDEDDDDEYPGESARARAKRKRNRTSL
jgi:hypothetical protein